MILFNGFRSLYNVTGSSVLIVGVLNLPLDFIIFIVINIIIFTIIIIIIIINIIINIIIITIIVIIIIGLMKLLYKTIAIIYNYQNLLVTIENIFI